MDEEERQRQIDEAAREAARRSMDTIEPAMEASTPVHRVELAPDPTLDRPLDVPGAPDATTAALDEMAGGQRDYDQTPVESQSVDYGAAVQRQMDRAIHYRDDEPASALASPQGTPAPQAAQAPSVAAVEAAPDAADAALSEMAGPAEATKPPVDAEREAAAGPLPTLADGLPTEGDISSARTADPFREILHRISNAFLGAAGRPLQSFESTGDRLAEERRTGIAQRQTAKGAMRREDAAAARQQGTDDRAERSLALGERRASIAEGQAQTQAEATRALISQRDAQTQHLTTSDEIARGDRAAMSDAASGESDSARRAWVAGLARLPDRMRESLSTAISPEELPTMTAAQLEGPLRMVERLSVGVRQGGGATGGGGQSLADMRQAARPILERLGLPPDSADILDRDHLQSLVSQAGLTAARSEDTTERLRAAADLRRGGTGTGQVEILDGVFGSSSLNSAVEPRQMRTSFAHARTQYASLDQVGDIASRYGASAPISPSVVAELGGPLSRLRAMVATLQNTGIINPSEAPAIEAMLPDPRSVSQMTFGTLQSRLESFRGELERNIDSELTAHGVDETGIQEALRQLRGGHVRARPTATAAAPAPDEAPAPTTAATAPPDGDMITVIDNRPGRTHGQTRRVTRAQAARLPQGVEIQ